MLQEISFTTQPLSHKVLDRSHKDFASDDMPVDLSTQVEYYNTLWSNERYANLLQLERCNAILEEFRSLKFLNPTTCDLGCGTGWLTGILAAFGPAVGVELSNVAVEQASKRYPNARFVCSDILQWQPEERFDVVVSQEVIEHFQDQARYLSVAHKILKPGGLIVLTTPNQRTVKAAPEEYHSHQPIENWLTRSQLFALMSPYFSNVKIRSIILGYGHAGSYKIINSARLQRVFQLFGLEKAWRSVALISDYGLHFVATGSRKA